MSTLRRALSCAIVAVTAISFSSAISTSAHAQDGTAQSQVVSSVPATYTPDINDGTTYAINQVGTQIFSGGSFTNESNHGSTAVVNQKYLFAFDASTGAINASFAPVLDGTVQSIQPGPSANTVYVAGAFNTVNGVKSKSIVLLNTTNGAIVTGWKPAVPNGIGQAVRYVHGQLLLGGTFSTVGAAPHSGLVSLNPNTGAVTAYTNVQFTGHHNYGVNGTGANAGVGVNAMTTSPDGTRLVAIGNFKNADGNLRDQIAMLDLTSTSATLDTQWYTTDYSAACYSGPYDSYVRDVTYSPDGTFFVVGATGGSGTNLDGSRSLCDSAARWSATDIAVDKGPDRGMTVDPTWVDYTGNDTILSVAITNTVVYVGGHERWLNNPNAYDQAGPGAVPRPGMAALDPASGLPLTWNPGRNPRGAGAYAMFASATGLYVGSDTMYFGNYKYLHKRIGYFPLTGGYVPASTATASLPANVYEAGPLPASTDTNVLYRVDAGGPALAAIDNGPDWLADRNDSDPGAAYRNTGSNSADWSPVANVNTKVPASTPRALFDHERWGAQSWDFPVATGTSIQVRLYFANRYSGTSQPGQRTFDVDLDNTRVLSNYDIVTDTGDQTGTVKTFDITSDGHVNIDLRNEVENPLIDGIEIVKTGGGPTTGASADLAYRAYSGSMIGALTTVPNTGIDWSTTRGAFMVGSTIFYGTTAGKFYKASFDGKNVGPAVSIDPYNDPTWDGVDTGSGNTYDGVKTGYYDEVSNVTGAFYSDGRLYYSQFGSSSLYWRYFSPDSGIIGGQEFTVAGANFPNTAGEFLSGSTLYYANRSDGTLHTIAFSNGATNGATPSVDMSTDTTVSGPPVDSNDWRAHGLFAFGKATFPDKPPVARATASCANLTCSFDGSGSSDPDGTVVSYAWDFGDGSTGTGAKPTHGYAKAGMYTYTLTVTDDQGTASPMFSDKVTATATATPPIAYRAVAHSYATSTTSAKVITPSTVAPGDTELLFVSASNATANAIATPSGWTQVATQSPLPLQTALFRRTAVAGDAGSTVAVTLSSASAVTLQLADYAGVGSGAISATTAADTAVTASHTAPATNVTVAGSWVISYWSDRSSSTTGWNLPSALANRDVTVGTGGGHTSGAVADSNGPVATGSYPAQTASVVGGSSGKAAMITVVVAPQS